MIITAERLTQVCPSLKGQRAINIAKYLTDACPKYGIVNYDIFHEFLARLIHECMEFTRFEENLNYSAKALISLFGRHRISVAQANAFGRIPNKKAANKVAIANILYGGAWGKKHLGNIHPNDGYNLRGSGGMQITGRLAATMFTNYYNALHKTKYTIEEMMVLMRTNVQIAVESACWVFSVFKNLIQKAINDKLKEIVISINGGTFGLEETEELYNKIVKVFV